MWSVEEFESALFKCGVEKERKTEKVWTEKVSFFEGLATQENKRHLISYTCLKKNKRPLPLSTSPGCCGFENAQRSFEEEEYFRWPSQYNIYISFLQIVRNVDTLINM